MAESVHPKLVMRLRPAYAALCPNCEGQVWVPEVRLTGARELEARCDIGDFESDNLMSNPEEVVCPYCSQCFRTLVDM